MTRAQHLARTLAALLDGDPWYGPPLKSTLQGVSAVAAAAKPIGSAHSIWEIVQHIDAWNRVCLRRLAWEVVVEPPVDFPEPDTITPAAWRDAQVLLDESCRELIERASETEDEQLEATVPGKEHSVDFLFEGVGQHWIYHAGQIALLRRAVVG